MYKSWTVIVAIVGIISVGGLVAAAGFHFSGRDQAEALPLGISLSARAAAADEGVTLTIQNVMGRRIFVPSSWEGIAIYRLEPGSWREYYFPSPYQPMVHTDQQEIHYHLPGGSLEPGRYKLVIQGRQGQDGRIFELETTLEVCEYRLLNVDLFWDTGQPLTVIITNNRSETVILPQEDFGISLHYRQGKSWVSMQLDLSLSQDLPRQIKPGQILKIPVSRVPVGKQFEVVVDGQDAFGNHVRGSASLAIDTQ